MWQDIGAYSLDEFLACLFLYFSPDGVGLGHHTHVPLLVIEVPNDPRMSIGRPAGVGHREL